MNPPAPRLEIIRRRAVPRKGCGAFHFDLKDQLAPSRFVPRENDAEEVASSFGSKKMREENQIKDDPKRVAAPRRCVCCPF
jgi:hypothetical protein